MNSLVLAALSGIVLLQGAEAACCRTNKCLKAVGYDAGAVGLADCSANLAMTVTVPVSTATETLTIFESAHDTVFVTETTTETTSTETQLLTQVKTITASTQTETIIAVTVTEPFTIIELETAAAITSTFTQYSLAPTALKARQTDTATEEVPEYASEDCANWAEYTRACKCAGVSVATVTASVGPVETVTLTASGAVTTTVSTLTATETHVVPVTATTSSTVTSQFSIVHTTTVEEIATVTVTTAVQSTTTPTTVVPLMCKATGVFFQASMPFTDGSTRWINKLWSGNLVATQSFAGGAPALDDPTATWVLDSGGFLELALLQPGGTEKLAAYYDMAATKASVQIGVLPKSQVIAGVATGRLGRLKGCVSPANNQLFISAGSDRHNMLSCGNQFYMSSGDGSDYSSSGCVRLTPHVRT